MQRFVVVSLLLILSGCGVKSGRFNELPAITDKEMAGKIVVVRTNSFYGVLVRWDIALDEKSLFDIGSGEYIEFLLPEGEHYITLGCSQTIITGGMQFEDALKFVVKPSQTIYFLVSPSWSCGKIRLSNETEAKEHIERSNTGYGYKSTEVAPIDANLPKRPLIETLPVTIGVYYSPEFSTHESIEELEGHRDRDRYKFNLGSDSVTLFDQVFVSMFEKVIPVENRSPLRTNVPKINAVIEPRIKYLRIGVVPQSQNEDEYCWVRIYYHITLYSPDGGLLALFRVDAVGESRPGYSIGVKSFSEAMHFAMRDAAAQVMTGFSDEPGVREWLQALGVVSSVMSPKWRE